MSKYKYTSLLSSEYRSVFKSYHSVDRYERQKFLTSSTTHKERSTHSQLKYAQNKSIYEPKHKFETINHISSYYTSKFQSKTDNLRKINANSNEFHQSFERPFDATFIDHQRLLSRIRNKYESNSNQNFYKNNQTNVNVKTNDQIMFETKDRNYQTIQNEEDINFAEQIPCKRPYIQYKTIPHKNTELKMKVSEITKKRNEIKLKMRVNDIDEINRKYNYLLKQNNQNQRPHQNHYAPSKNMYQSSSILNPLQQINPNKINLKLQRKILENMTNKKIIGKQARNYGQQNIQTPHFNNAETRIKQIDVSLIEKKLQNIVKNTFTDRY